MTVIQVPDSTRYRMLSTAALREAFLLQDLFIPGEIRMDYLDMDRTIVGAAIPVKDMLRLAVTDELRAQYFLERREMGILNIGGAGAVMADGKTVEMNNLDCLYVGRGVRDLAFTSADAGMPAQFYLLSYPAHTAYPTVLAKKRQAAAVPLGSVATLNKRTIYKYIHPEGIKSCQLVMGFTELEAGSGWNTMPPHTHTRRSEVYLYFNLAENARVFHMMGLPDETRHLVVGDKQAVISPSWSIHAGVGTSHYTFCWGMGGENQAFDDMDGVAVSALR